MKKSLIALAVAGVVAAPVAFADTTIYGKLDGAVAHVSADHQRSATLAVSGGLSTSRLGVKGSEDLGNGLAAVYQYEVALDGATNQGLGGASTAAGTAYTGNARQSLLGLKGDFGTAAIGFLQTTGYDFANKFDPLGGSLVSASQNAVAAIGGTLINTSSRAQRAVAYISPAFSGVTVAVNHVTAVTGTGNLGVSDAAPDASVTANMFSGNFDQGPLSVGAVYSKTSNPSSAADMKEFAIGGSYDLGVAKVLSTYQTRKIDAAGTPANETNKAFALSGVIPAGPGAAIVSYGKATNKTASNTDSTAYSLAYAYGLSKTATAYAAYSHVGNDSAGIASVMKGALGVAGGASSSLLAVGLRKEF